MLTLVTTNPAKYASFQREFERLRIELRPPPEPLPELQSLSFAEALAAKAKAMASVFGRPVLVDDAGLVLEAFRPFPGPLTSLVIQGLGVGGLGRLLTANSAAATMECHLGCWVHGGLRTWTGSVAGRIDASRKPRDPRMPLSDLFVPDTPSSDGTLLHRAKALAALADDALDLHLALAQAPAPCESVEGFSADYQCPFCVEWEGESQTVFNEYLQERLTSRIVYEDDHFVLVPPLGSFIEGGLLLLTREHIPSLAYLPPQLWPHLEQLLQSIQKALVARWGTSPLIFEHGSAMDRTKGHCCVDHAHLNIFPAKVPVHPHLASRMHLKIGPLSELIRLQAAEFGYLFVQENDGIRYVYDAQDAPTQLVRRIISSQIGMPERWHWRDYPGCDELTATYHALKGQIHL